MPTTQQIRPRKLGEDFSGPIPRAWFAGSPAITGIANGVNLLFPIGERFFVRSVLRHVNQLDPELQALARGFFGQEGRHAGAHERFFQAMREQGYEFERFLEVFEAWIKWQEEHFPASFALASTAAAEHYTAMLAETVLRRDALRFADPALRGLLYWHAAEEIEHKSVAFDALRQVSPGYAVRMIGLALASATLFSFWAWATVMLWKQDGLSVPAALRELGAMREKARAAGLRSETGPVVRTAMLRGLLQYVRPGFHPSDNDDAELARKYLAEAGFEPAEA